MSGVLFALISQRGNRYFIICRCCSNIRRISTAEYLSFFLFIRKLFVFNRSRCSRTKMLYLYISGVVLVIVLIVKAVVMVVVLVVVVVVVVE